MTKEEFLKNQPLISSFYLNAVKKNHLPHALLIYGDNLAPIDEIAEFLAKSLFCDENLACSNCEHCKLFDENRIGDFYIIDGRNQNIKKDQIEELSNQFVLTNKEENKCAAYIIYEVSNMTEESANALLKFLEEPPANVYAILTTTSKESILPTIISRVVSLRAFPQKYNYKEGSIDPKALFLIQGLRLKEDPLEIAADKTFNTVFEMAIDFLNLLVFNYEKGIDLLFSKISANLKDQTCYNYFYGIVYQVFICISTNNTDSPFKEIILGLKSHKEAIYNATIFLEKILSAKKLNYNFTLVLGKLATILEAK